MLWFYLASATSVLWGLGYVFSEKIMHHGISPALFLVIFSVLSAPMYLALALYNGGIKESLNIISGNSTLLFYIIAATFAFTLGSLLIFAAMQLKNASLVNIIEITYPVFTIFFTWLLFKEFHLNWAHMAGGALVLSGIFLIFLKA